MTRSIRLRLAVMMFLQYFTMGATMPILGHYLKNYLHFEPMEVGKVLAMPATAAFIAPFFVAQVADRWISAERLLGLCHLLGGGVMLWLSRQHSYPSFLAVFLLYSLIQSPTFAMTNTIALHHATDAKRDFGSIRLWGTIGWVAVGFAFGFLWLRGGGTEPATSRLPDALLLSGFMSLILCVYAMTLPRSHGKTSQAARTASTRGAFSVFAKPGVGLLCGLAFFGSVLNQYYMQWISPYLSQCGYTDAQIMPLLTLGQISEIVVMGSLGRILLRVGMKRTMALGLAMQGVRFVAFSIGSPSMLVVAGLCLHGLTYAFFFVVAFIYLDTHCTKEQRAGAQLLFNMVVSGFGSLSGSLLAGKSAQLLTIPGTTLINFRIMWLIPTVIAAVVLTALLLRFRDEPAKSAPA
ncbi:MAG: MFS transporter [Candidatus Hydrogenedentes bacterium]|nr:MFS transporter [Candidatus Hydrogenedentota bacterium]